MIKNYLIANFRMLWKNRTHSLINLAGLSLGITCAIVLYLVVKFELSFDNFHEDKDRLYRVVTTYTREEEPGFSAGITYVLPDAVRQDFGDVEYATVVDSNFGNPVIAVTHDNGRVDRYKEPAVTFVDPEYFKMFKYNWIEGNDDALKGEKTVVLSKSIAEKYFGKESAINKVININNDFDVTVTGVYQDPPMNTDLPFKIIFSNKLGNSKHAWDNWDSTSSSINCYVKLNPGVSLADFNAKMDGWHMKYFTGKLEEDGRDRRYFLQPLSDIHFDTRFGNFGGRVVSFTTIISLSLIGTFLLITACINFINLNTVLIINRSKEAGIRKVLGSSRRQLIFQFLSETFVITLIALFISGALSELMLLKMNPILGYRLSLFENLDGPTLLFLFSLPIVVTLLAGAYPAYRLSWFQPVKVLKGRLETGFGQGLSLRRTLIVLQLVIAQVLVVSTVVIVQQINYFTSQPLGLDSHAVLEFELPENEYETIHTLRERLQQLNTVENATMSNTGSTANNTWGGGFEAVVAGKKIKAGTQVKFADENYIQTYGLTLLVGENLVPSDTANRFVVNEDFVKALGIENNEDAIGVPVDIWGRKAQIVGIVKNYNTNSLHNEREPVIILSGTGGFQVGAARLKTSSLKDGVEDVRRVWESVYPKYVFESAFLDDTIENFYEAERRNGYMISIFAGVAIVIGCIGLFGLVSFMAKQKTKEIGIRKTLGASIPQVVSLFSKEFIVLIAISFVIASPAAYYIMNQWLENFAYHIQPGVLTFLIGVTITLIVVLGTVGIKSYRAATANPVDALRDE